MAKTLAQLRALAAEWEAAQMQLAQDGATAVTIGGRSLTRLTPRQVQLQLNAVNAEINRRESGGSYPFDRTNLRLRRRRGVGAWG